MLLNILGLCLRGTIQYHHILSSFWLFCNINCRFQCVDGIITVVSRTTTGLLEDLGTAGNMSLEKTS